MAKIFAGKVQFEGQRVSPKCHFGPKMRFQGHRMSLKLHFNVDGTRSFSDIARSISPSGRAGMYSMGAFDIKNVPVAMRYFIRL